MTEKHDDNRPSSDNSQMSLQSPLIKLNPAYVPLTLHSLIPYAEKWGIPDEDLQRRMLQERSIEEVENLCVILYPLWDELFTFATSHPSSQALGSYEVETFNAFRPVFEEAFSILDEKKPQRLLEIIKWPEAWINTKLDTTKLAPELLPLVPYTEKWAIQDEGVRWTAIKTMTDTEVKELLSIVDEVGQEKIENLAYTMLDNEALREEGYMFIILMELVDYLRRKK